MKFQIALNGTVYIINMRWNTFSSCWVMDITDQSSAPVVSGIPLVTGADLLAQLQYLGIKGRMICQTDHAPNVVPTYTSLGGTGHLYFMPTP